MYFFIGIKGTGMAALAMMLHDIGEEVAGSDLKKHFFTEDELVKREIAIYPFNKENIKDNYIVIIGNAFLEDFEEVVEARNNPTCKCYRYHEFLGLLMEKYKSISICGSHGKTTTTTMLARVFSAFKNTAYLIGDGEGYLNENSEFLCVESCEYRRHFLAYRPDYAIITNIEIDHVDYFKDENDYFLAYQEFVKNVKEAVFYCGDDSECRRLKIDIPSFSYGFNDDNDFKIENLVEDDESSAFDISFKGEFIAHYNLPFVGHHLLLDALAVISLATVMCFDHRLIENVLINFKTPKRRYKIEEFKDAIIIDDYAHHPTEVKVTLEASKKRYPKKEIIAIFKPHRASRVYHFKEQFIEALSLADKVYLLDFTSIDDKQDGINIDISYLANDLEKSEILSEDDSGARILAKHRDACFVFMSSKDIYNLEALTKKYL